MKHCVGESEAKQQQNNSDWLLAQNMIDSYFFEAVIQFEVQGSNEICRTTLELKTDSNVELLDLYLRNKHFRVS